MVCLVQLVNFSFCRTLFAIVYRLRGAKRIEDASSSLKPNETSPKINRRCTRDFFSLENNRQRQHRTSIRLNIAA